jgi:hypothetical protein
MSQPRRRHALMVWESLVEQDDNTFSHLAVGHNKGCASMAAAVDQCKLAQSFSGMLRATSTHAHLQLGLTRLHLVPLLRQCTQGGHLWRFHAPGWRCCCC